jgi:hypothetical protein
LWTLDNAGQLARVERPGAKADGPAIVMDWPRKDGTVYVGVPPQHGGQVYEYDLASGKAAPVGGAFNGIGPMDSMNLVMTEQYRVTWKKLQACYALEKLSRQRRGVR